MHDTPPRTPFRLVFVVLPYVLLGLLPAMFWVALLIDIAERDALAYDFQHFFYPQARDLLAGVTPVTAYPPLGSMFYVPFALLPSAVADVVVTAAMIACAGAVLLVLGIKDWRCYCALMLWAPVFGAVQTANLSLPLALGVALLWRYRGRALAAGTLVALMVATKLLLWPLAGWLLATRRWRAAGLTVGIGVLASAAAWAVIGFGTLSQFPELLRGNVQDNGTKPYTVAAVLQQLGTSAAFGYAVCWALGGLVLLAAVRTARRGREADALALFVAAALILSPIVWAHYLALLIVPVALARPRFCGLWLAPLPLWLCPQVDPGLPQKLLLLTTAAAIIVACVRGPLTLRLPWHAQAAEAT